MMRFLMVTFLREDIPTEIDSKIKELLELLNKKSQNEVILSDFEAKITCKVEDNLLSSYYEINFKTLLLKDKTN